MVTFDCKKTIKNIKGEDMKNGGEPVSFGSVVCDSLCALREDHSRAFALAKKFATEDSVELKAEEVVLAKKAVNNAGVSALVGAQILEELDK